MDARILNKVTCIIKDKISYEDHIVIDYNTLLCDIQINSIEFIEIIVEIESFFGFEFDEERLLFDSFLTIHSIVEYVESKIYIY